MSAFARRSLIVSACALSVLLLAWFFWTVARALLLIFSAFLVAVAIDGLSRLLRMAVPLGRHAAVMVTTTVLALGLGFTLTFGTLNVAEQAPELRTQFAQSIDSLQHKLGEYQITQRWLSDSFLGGGVDQGGKHESQSHSIGHQLTNELSNAASLTLTTLTDFFVIAIIGAYLALQPGLYTGGVLRLFPTGQRERAEDIGREAADAVRRWLTGRVISMSVVAVCSIAGLALIGIPFAFLLGLTAGLLTFIPYLGALVATVPALLVAGLHGYWPMVYVAALYLGLHVVEGYLLAPMIQKRAVSIAPAFLLTVQVIGGAIAGVIGIALATPITLVIAVVLQLAYVRDVLGDTPHLPGSAEANEAAEAAQQDNE